MWQPWREFLSNSLTLHVYINIIKYAASYEQLTWIEIHLLFKIIEIQCYSPVVIKKCNYFTKYCWRIVSHTQLKNRILMINVNWNNLFHMLAFIWMQLIKNVEIWKYKHNKLNAWFWQSLWVLWVINGSLIWNAPV